MDASRKLLSLGPSSSKEARIATNANALRQAIEHHLCVRWSYNRALMRAAPLILYRRDEDLHVDSLVLKKHGAPPTGIKTASFRLSGLADVAVTMEPIPDTIRVKRADPRYAEGVEAAIT